LIGRGRERLRLQRLIPRGGAIDFRYRITGYEDVIQSHHPLWQAPLPTLTRGTREAKIPDITHADYFRAVRSYLTGAGRPHIRQALAARRPQMEAPFEPDRMEIILEKHGEFYHPARIDVTIGGDVIPLVLNVAVTPAGGEWMASEMAALNRVADRLPPGRVPTVFGYAVISGATDVALPMFLADWFDGFHEFHLSIDSRSGGQGMVVWDTDATPFFLAAQQQAEVYRQAAFLLTRAYDPGTTEQIYPWHHASGDFVLRVRGASVDLRLITVRQYAPTLTGDDEALDDDARLMALLVFFLNLTLRNRLDRLDGTGEPAWADPRAVAATVQGFIEALPAELAVGFKGLLRAYDTAELVDLLTPVADRYGLMPMEQPLIHANLARHGEQLFEVLQRMLHDH
jgi:hypothetical protein